LLLFPVVVAVGVLFPAVSSVRPDLKENVMDHRLLDGLFYLSLATSAFWVWRMRGRHSLATSLLLLQQVILIGAGFGRNERQRRLVVSATVIDEIKAFAQACAV